MVSNPFVGDEAPYLSEVPIGIGLQSLLINPTLALADSNRTVNGPKMLSPTRTRCFKPEPESYFISQSEPDLSPKSKSML